jgi:hypothetical protein
VSWDIFGLHLPPEIKTKEDIPSGFEPAPIGPRSEIIAKITALYPECNFSNPSWGVLDHPDCVIEFSMREGVVTVLAMCVRGNGGDVVARILARRGLRALDTMSDSGVFEPDPVLRAQSFTRWQSYLSAIADHLASEDKARRGDR